MSLPMFHAPTHVRKSLQLSSSRAAPSPPFSRSLRLYPCYKNLAGLPYLIFPLHLFFVWPFLVLNLSFTRFLSAWHQAEGFPNLCLDPHRNQPMHAPPQTHARTRHPRGANPRPDPRSDPICARTPAPGLACVLVVEPKAHQAEWQHMYMHPQARVRSGPSPGAGLGAD